MNKRRLIILYFIFLVVFGSVGFYILGGENWSWIDSIYMTVITLSTVGFGEVHPLTDSGKILSVFIIIFGVTGIGVLIRTFSEEFIQIDKFRKNKMMRNISNLKNHFVICGYGRMGAVIAQELHNKHLDFVVIEMDDHKAEHIVSKGWYCVHGDATSEETLISARIENATGVAVVLANDQDNLFVTLSMKTSNPNLFILSRCSIDDNQSKMIRAGANKVVNPYTAGGHRIAEILSKPQVEDSISVLSPIHSSMNLTLDEISLDNMSKYEGVLLKDSKFREEYDVMVVGIINQNGDSIINPSPDTVLHTTDTILLMGDTSNMARFKENLPS
ncbi:MAG: potassium channel protein [Candidatus Marinimicrobia bacterium]|jgi:voltage-gated potassium channel|nr:potassium channel protein [Candidatus Neomarinimicrobiota bacterium]MBT3501189.1 potassium channel protein [Candidatus Neomarinimicrobiota bacterium]MBT3839471.1 potassium channel protein [Candidatus Neomarinimicrobiota bacterium]MBT3999371.1 potassium channel protein [Candidatus Neomarinimicrobiota bacterium]MBT4281994.1 potassium channel protein [Candidatus Neomarinimicrobiota bacterium]